MARIAAAIESGSVVTVHTQRRTVDVALDGVQEILEEIPYTELYCNTRSGTAIDFVPEVGSQCYVFRPTDGGSPFVGGWIVLPKSGAEENGEAVPDHLGSRYALMPGDIALYNGDGAFAVLRKGGSLQIGASPLCQTMYIPLENLIRGFFENIQHLSPLGSIEWKHGAVEDDTSTSGEKATNAVLVWKCKAFTEDQHIAIRFRAGAAGKKEHNPGGDELFGNKRDGQWKYSTASTYANYKPEDTTILSICINPKGQGDTFIFQIDTEGNVFTKISGTLHAEMYAAYVKLESGFTVDIGSLWSLSCNSGALEAKIQTMVIDAIKSVTLTSSQIHLASPSISLGPSGAHPVLLGDLFLAAFYAHKHDPFTQTVVAPPPFGLLSLVTKTD